MTKVNYERVHKANLTPLANVKTGEVIRWEDDLYIVTNSYEDIEDESFYRILMDITDGNFGEVEYINENTEVEILEDAEITIKY